MPWDIHGLPDYQTALQHAIADLESCYAYYYAHVPSVTANDPYFCRLSFGGPDFPAPLPPPEIGWMDFTNYYPPGPGSPDYSMASVLVPGGSATTQAVVDSFTVPVRETWQCNNGSSGSGEMPDFIGLVRTTAYCEISPPYYEAKICQSLSYVIKLSRPDGSSIDSTFLDEIEPGNINGPIYKDTTLTVGSETIPIGRDTSYLVAKVYDQNGQVVPDTDVSLKVDVVNQSGGHLHGVDGDLRHTNYSGLLAPVDTSSGVTVSDNGRTLTGNTGTSGLFFTYNSPLFPNDPAGDYVITATCTNGKTCTQQGGKTVWVGVKGLVNIPDSGLWVFVGMTGSHPNNHYVNGAALGKLMDLAYEYHQVYFPFDSVLHLNDASLERGGVFDLYPKTPPWMPPHKEHRRGLVIDIRANNADGAIPRRNFADFEDLLQRLGMTKLLEDQGTTNEHFHVRLLGIAR